MSLLSVLTKFRLLSKLSDRYIGAIVRTVFNQNIVTGMLSNNFEILGILMLKWYLQLVIEDACNVFSYERRKI